MPRIAAIDVGTNSVRCLVADADRAGRLVIVTDHRSYTRMGRGLAETGTLGAKAMDRTLEALQRMSAEAADLGADSVRAVATAAVRSAGNGQDFVRRVAEHTGIRLEVISPQEEGRLAYLSAAAEFDLGPSGVVFDLGGGSLEIVARRDGRPRPATSAPIGAVLTSERFIDGDPVSDAAFARMRGEVRAAIAEMTRDAAPPVSALVGSGGTARAIAAVTRGRRATDGTSTHGVLVPRAEIGRLAERLRASTAEDRAAIPRMPKRRADIMLAGVLVVAELASALKADAMRINALGVRGGIVLDAVAR